MIYNIICYIVTLITYRIKVICISAASAAAASMVFSRFVVLLVFLYVFDACVCIICSSSSEGTKVECIFAAAASMVFSRFVVLLVFLYVFDACVCIICSS